ncbi:MAG: hypothetical protein JKY11_06585 [Alphaproteobacteria bacterium]|nr:hypothetical protein [Alphaproteobacteria bacterium]
MISKNFKRIALGTALALTTAFSTPAMAGKDFVKQDLSDRSTELVQIVGQRLSANKLTFVVHGGNKNLQMAAYRVAQRLDEEGVPIAFLLAPDRDGMPQTMHVDYYAKGGTKYFVTAYDNKNITIATTEANLYSQAKKAYNEDFGRLVLVSSTDDLPAQTLAAR